FLRSLLPVAGEGEDHGAFVTLEHKDAGKLAAQLEKQSIKTDARGEYLRIGPDILNPRGELEHAARGLKDLLARCRSLPGSSISAGCWSPSPSGGLSLPGPPQPGFRRMRSRRDS